MSVMVSSHRWNKLDTDNQIIVTSTRVGSDDTEVMNDLTYGSFLVQKVLFFIIWGSYIFFSASYGKASKPNSLRFLNTENLYKTVPSQRSYFFESPHINGLPQVQSQFSFLAFSFKTFPSVKFAFLNYFHRLFSQDSLHNMSDALFHAIIFSSFIVKLIFFMVEFKLPP